MTVDQRDPATPRALPALGDGGATLSPEQIVAIAAAQHPGANNPAERAIVLRQMLVALILILGGALVATLGVLFVKESDATKLTAIISIATAVIGAGAALLPTGAAAGAASRILSSNFGAGPVTVNPTPSAPLTGPIGPDQANGHH